MRAASAQDHDAILALWLDLIEHHRRLSPLHPSSAPNLREVLANEIRRGTTRTRCRLLVAEQAGARIGFLFAEVETGGGSAELAPLGWIHELWVTPEARRRGVASALVDEADGFFAAHRVERVSVRVESANDDALRYWARRGFGERARILERVT